MKKIGGLAAGIGGITLIATAIRFRLKKRMAIAVIGGADGPTSVFIAGKLGVHTFKMLFIMGLFIAGLILLVLGIVWILKGRKK